METNISWRNCFDSCLKYRIFHKTKALRFVSGVLQKIITNF